MYRYILALTCTRTLYRIVSSKHVITAFALITFIGNHDTGSTGRLICRMSSQFVSLPTVLAYTATNAPVYTGFRSPSINTAVIRTKRYNHLLKKLQKVHISQSASSIITNDSSYDVIKENDMNTDSDTNTDTGNTKATIVGTIQILMSDTGGGHRASAYALRDAFDVLYPGQIYCDIVDLYTEYGTIWPFKDYVAIYKYMTAHPWMWQLLYNFGKTNFGLWFNQIMLEIFCTDGFTKCICRPQPNVPCMDYKFHPQQRANMIISVHPLAQDLPLKIVTQIDQKSNYKDGGGGGTHRTTPFCTVVTDLGSAHPTWFNPGYVYP
jgi:Monogalactosyldiacylglycerol (MGDG) synthase